MPWWTWVSLALFLVVVLGGGTVALVLGLRTWRRVRAVQSSLLASVASLTHAAEDLERRAETVAKRTEELERRLASLQRSTEKLSVLGWALRDSRDAIVRIRRAVPRK